jgi:hypothetical protein
VTFLRLSRWDLAAFATALALLVTMSFLWYTTHQAEDCRRNESLQTAPSVGGPENDELNGKLKSDAHRCEAKYDKTAWSASAFVDRLALLAMLAAIASAIVAAFLRAADRRPALRRTPSEIAAITGLVATLLILYRILQPPGLNDAAVVKLGAPVGLALAGILTFAARAASRAEREAAAAAPVAAPPPDASAREPEPPPAGPAEPAPSA